MAKTETNMRGRDRPSVLEKERTPKIIYSSLNDTPTLSPSTSFSSLDSGFIHGGSSSPPHHSLEDFEHSIPETSTPVLTRASILRTSSQRMNSWNLSRSNQTEPKDSPRLKFSLPVEQSGSSSGESDSDTGSYTINTSLPPEKSKRRRKVERVRLEKTESLKSDYKPVVRRIRDDKQSVRHKIKPGYVSQLKQLFSVQDDLDVCDTNTQTSTLRRHNSTSDVSDKYLTIVGVKNQPAKRAHSLNNINDRKDFTLLKKSYDKNGEPILNKDDLCRQETDDVDNQSSNLRDIPNTVTKERQNITSVGQNLNRNQAGRKPVNRRKTDSAAKQNEQFPKKLNIFDSSREPESGFNRSLSMRLASPVKEEKTPGYFLRSGSLRVSNDGNDSENRINFLRTGSLRASDALRNFLQRQYPTEDEQKRETSIARINEKNETKTEKEVTEKANTEKEKKVQHKTRSLYKHSVGKNDSNRNRSQESTMRGITIHSPIPEVPKENTLDTKDTVSVKDNRSKVPSEVKCSYDKDHKYRSHLSISERIQQALEHNKAAKPHTDMTKDPHNSSTKSNFTRIGSDRIPNNSKFKKLENSDTKFQRTGSERISSNRQKDKLFSDVPQIHSSAAPKSNTSTALKTFLRNRYPSEENVSCKPETSVDLPKDSKHEFDALLCKFRLDHKSEDDWERLRSSGEEKEVTYSSRQIDPALAECPTPITGTPPVSPDKELSVSLSTDKRPQEMDSCYFSDNTIHDTSPRTNLSGSSKDNSMNHGLMATRQGHIESVSEIIVLGSNERCLDDEIRARKEKELIDNGKANQYNGIHFETKTSSLKVELIKCDKREMPKDKTLKTRKHAKTDVTGSETKSVRFDAHEQVINLEWDQNSLYHTNKWDSHFEVCGEMSEVVMEEHACAFDEIVPTKLSTSEEPIHTLEMTNPIPEVEAQMSSKENRDKKSNFEFCQMSHVQGDRIVKQSIHTTQSNAKETIDSGTKKMPPRKPPRKRKSNPKIGGLRAPLKPREDRCNVDQDFTSQYYSNGVSCDEESIHLMPIKTDSAQSSPRFFERKSQARLEVKNEASFIDDVDDAARTEEFDHENKTVDDRCEHYGDSIENVSVVSDVKSNHKDDRRGSASMDKDKYNLEYKGTTNKTSSKRPTQDNTDFQVHEMHEKSIKCNSSDTTINKESTSVDTNIPLAMESYTPVHNTKHEEISDIIDMTTVPSVSIGDFNGDMSIDIVMVPEEFRDETSEVSQKSKGDKTSEVGQALKADKTSEVGQTSKEFFVEEIDLTNSLEDLNKTPPEPCSNNTFSVQKSVTTDPGSNSDTDDIRQYKRDTSEKDSKLSLRIYGRFNSKDTIESEPYPVKINQTVEKSEEEMCNSFLDFKDSWSSKRYRKSQNNPIFTKPEKSSTIESQTNFDRTQQQRISSVFSPGHQSVSAKQTSVFNMDLPFSKTSLSNSNESKKPDGFVQTNKTLSIENDIFTKPKRRSSETEDAMKKSSKVSVSNSSDSETSSEEGEYIIETSLDDGSEKHKISGNEYSQIYSDKILENDNQKYNEQFQDDVGTELKLNLDFLQETEDEEFVDVCDSPINQTKINTSEVNHHVGDYNNTSYKSKRFVNFDVNTDESKVIHACPSPGDHVTETFTGKTLTPEEHQYKAKDEVKTVVQNCDQLTVNSESAGDLTGYSKIAVLREVSSGYKMPEKSSGNTKTSQLSEYTGGKKITTKTTTSVNNDGYDEYEQTEQKRNLALLTEAISKLNGNNTDDIIPEINQTVTKLNGGNLVITTLTHRVVEEEDEAKDTMSSEIEPSDVRNKNAYIVQDHKGDTYMIEDITDEYSTSERTYTTEYEAVSPGSESPSYQRIHNLKAHGHSGVGYDTAEEVILSLYNPNSMEYSETDERYHSGQYTSEGMRGDTRLQPYGYSDSSSNRKTTSYEYEDGGSPYHGSSSVKTVKQSYEMSSDGPWVTDGKTSSQDTNMRKEVTKRESNYDQSGMNSMSAAYMVEANSSVPQINPYFVQQPLIIPQLPIPQYNLLQLEPVPLKVTQGVQVHTEEKVEPKIVTAPDETDSKPFKERPVYKSVALVKGPYESPKWHTAKKHKTYEPPEDEVDSGRKYKVVRSSATDDVREETVEYEENTKTMTTYKMENSGVSGGDYFDENSNFRSIGYNGGQPLAMNGSPEFMGRSSGKVNISKSQPERRPFRSTIEVNGGTKQYDQLDGYQSKLTSLLNHQQEYQTTPELDRKTFTDVDRDMRVVRGNILIKNNLEDGLDEYNDNINVFDNGFNMTKDNPLYNSDENIYKKYEEERMRQQERDMRDMENMAFETVDRFSKSKNVTRKADGERRKPRSKQNLTNLLLSRLSTMDSKDIRQTLDVKHRHEDIYGDPHLSQADGTSSKRITNSNYDTVTENVDLEMKDGKAYITITVTAERLTPIDYEFHVWRKNQAIVTRVVEIDFYADEQRRVLYDRVMERVDDEGYSNNKKYSHYTRRKPQEVVLSSQDTLDLFNELMEATGNEGDREDITVKTKRNKTILPENPFLY